MGRTGCGNTFGSTDERLVHEELVLHTVDGKKGFPLTGPFMGTDRVNPNFFLMLYIKLGF